MKVSGDARLHAPVETVWAALNDPAALVRAIPGCERLAADGPDSYHLTMTAGVAVIRGTYTGRIWLHAQQAPTAFLLKAEGAGGPGTVATTVAVRLAAAGDGHTHLSYDADALVGGVIAGVGQRMLTGVAKRMADEFFAALDSVLAAGEAEQTAQSESAPAVWEATRAGRPGAAPRSGGTRGFVAGAAAGAAATLAGVVVGRLIGWRRS